MLTVGERESVLHRKSLTQYRVQVQAEFTVMIFIEVGLLSVLH